MTTTTLKIASPTGGLLSTLRQALASTFGAAGKTLTRSQEAAEVREMARRVQACDPGFAADLYAAADRHETVDR
jgi:hypothetical protein